MQALKNRVALVTGSTGEGMGRSIAFTLAREGAKVVLNYGTGHPNNVLASEKVLEDLRALGGKGYAFKADTREEDEVKAMIDGIITLYGRIDFLVCNAGGPWDPQELLDIDHDQWRSVLKAEIDGLFYCVKHALPHMRKAHFGRIIAIGLANADRNVSPPFDHAIGKAARHHFIRMLAPQEISHRVTCNIVAPGSTPHFTMRQAVDAAKHGTTWKRRISVTPQDVAETVRYLCSDEAQFITGSVIELAGSS
jgi:NAD(P)-dependent dehydrogenase (short-subunit alcohol dehydrogenase family)